MNGYLEIIILEANCVPPHLILSLFLPGRSQRTAKTRYGLIAYVLCVFCELFDNIDITDILGFFVLATTEGQGRKGR